MINLLEIDDYLALALASRCKLIVTNGRRGMRLSFEHAVREPSFSLPIEDEAHAEALDAQIAKAFAELHLDLPDRIELRHPLPTPLDIDGAVVRFEVRARSHGPGEYEVVAQPPNHMDDEPEERMDFKAMRAWLAVRTVLFERKAIASAASAATEPSAPGPRL